MSTCFLFLLSEVNISLTFSNRILPRSRWLQTLNTSNNEKSENMEKWLRDMKAAFGCLNFFPVIEGINFIWHEIKSKEEDFSLMCDLEALSRACDCAHSLVEKAWHREARIICIYSSYVLVNNLGDYLSEQFSSNNYHPPTIKSTYHLLSTMYYRHCILDTP
jgi:hypothetical protein